MKIKISVPESEITIADSHVEQLTAGGVKALVEETVIEWVKAHFDDVVKWGDLGCCPNVPDQAREEEAL